MKRKLFRRAGASPGWGRAWLAALALAVVLGPWLGALHRLVHTQGPGAQGHSATHLNDVFGQHQRAVDCLAYDQLSHGDALPVQVQSLPPRDCPASPAWRGLALEPDRPWAAFRARAPPVQLA